MLAHAEHACKHPVLACHASEWTTQLHHTSRPRSQAARSHVKQRQLRLVAWAADGEQPDLIERIFGGLFGKQALEDRSPGGMQRLSEEALLEQYPATLTEFADPVGSDDKEMASFRPLLAQTRLQTLPLRHVCGSSAPPLSSSLLISCTYCYCCL